MTMPTSAFIASGTDVKGLVLAGACATAVVALELMLPAKALPPRRLAIYYGYPSLVEGAAGDLSRAVRTFADYDVVVFGDGLELGQASPDAGLRMEHQRLMQIVARLHASARTPKLYGYVDLGRSQQLTDGEVARRIEEWSRLGVDGIFFDEAGADFGVTPARRTAAVRATHGHRLSAFMNAFNPDDLFEGRAAGPSRAPGDLGEHDGLLVESFAVRNGVVQSLEATRTRTAAALKWRTRTAINVFAVTTTVAGAFDRSAFAHAWHLAAALGVDGFGWGEPNFSADTKLPWRERPSDEKRPDDIR
jgi:hypothetical protein